MVFLTLRKAYLNYLRKKKEANNAKKNLTRANNALKRANNQYNMAKKNNFPVPPPRAANNQVYESRLVWNNSIGVPEERYIKSTRQSVNNFNANYEWNRNKQAYVRRRY